MLPIIPTTPLLGCVPRWDFVFVTMKYDKPPIELAQQLMILRQRGLEIENEGNALDCLRSISYFRLANYWKPMEIEKENHSFRPNSHFEEVVRLYLFDKRLRSLMFAAIQDLEVALRTRIIQSFSFPYGAFWFMDDTLFKDKVIYLSCLECIRKEVYRSNEGFIKEHFMRYDEPPLPPVWKTMEVVSFGVLSKLYCNFRDVQLKKYVASSFGLPQYTYLESWMKCATVLRNYCAHHARLWNRRFPWKPQLPERLPLKWIRTLPLRPYKLYAQLCYLSYLEQNITPCSRLNEKLSALLEGASPAFLKAMGFPERWKRGRAVSLKHGFILQTLGFRP